ncbi:MAG: response regulator [Pseudomonadota bacterium]|nr:response regulator [Pseudomonadota bacterium]
MNEPGDRHSILVVDDEPDICQLVERFLVREGYRVHIAGDGDAMRRILARTKIDLILLDVRLPGEDGLTLAREVRQSTAVAIIMLTSKNDVIDRVAGLETGADDYVPKPFHPRELLARIRAVLRRTQSSAPPARPAPSTIGFSGWRLNCETRELASPAGENVPLSPAEFDLLHVFLQHPNRVLSRDYLLDMTRGRAASPFDRAIDVHISHLRKKLEPDPKQPTLIRTIRNAGYLFTAAVTRQ